MEIRFKYHIAKAVEDTIKCKKDVKKQKTLTTRFLLEKKRKTRLQHLCLFNTLKSTLRNNSFGLAQMLQFVVDAGHLPLHFPRLRGKILRGKILTIMTRLLLFFNSCKINVNFFIISFFSSEKSLLVPTSIAQVLPSLWVESNISGTSSSFVPG